MNRADEFKTKMERISSYCAERDLDGVVLSKADAVAWLGCGADSTVNTAADGGVASFVVVDGDCCLVTNNIECERLLDEELAGVPVSGTEVFKWWEPDSKANLVRKLVAGKKAASDDGFAGLPLLGGDFVQLRYELTESECARYRRLGRDAADALEDTCFGVQRGMTEADVAAETAAQCRRRGINPIVLLVAADDRIAKWRHPIVKNVPLQHYVMIVICGRREGLIAAVTRLVSVVELDAALKQKHASVCHVDAALMAATRPGVEAQAVFAAARAAYKSQGFDGEWRLHHQGGAIGYQPREYVANPALATLVRSPQAFAWNPSIKGTKSEDTILVTDEGYEVLTAASDRFPMVEVEVDGRSAKRPDILVR